MENKIKKAFGSIAAEPGLIHTAYANVVSELKNEKRRKRRFAQGLSLVAASVAVLLFVVGIGLYNNETTYISIDVNPSISLSVNRFDKVIGATPYNEQGRALVESVDVRDKDYAEAVQVIIDSPQMQPYLAAAPAMWVTVQANDDSKEEAVERSVQSVVDTALAQHHAGTYVEYSCVDEQTRAEAERNGLSAAKYTAILELQQYDPDVLVEEYKHHSMHDINNEIASHHGNGGAQGHGGRGDGEGPGSQVPVTPTQPATQEDGQSHHGENHDGQSPGHNGH